MNEMEKTPESIRIHRVGTITSGLTLVLYGILFLARMFFPSLSFRVIFDLWPLILVILGTEILLSCTGKNVKEQKFIYDFPAFLIVMAMMFFALIMAAADYGMRYGGVWY
ncbi:MAG: DUF5668 domain-containing protein [Roseburia sp.]|nr:DUF5668 domain-containing protein [Ruminococcus sp.]MCM1156582.1 DUF5668 domain-containing protein [Roseburia sp.]MCM1243856.1 DUF5668 domain-containing protein [Roseburia sp.]